MRVLFVSDDPLSFDLERTYLRSRKIATAAFVPRRNRYLFPGGGQRSTHTLEKLLLDYNAKALSEAIAKLRPDVVHTLGLESGGGLILRSLPQLRKTGARWIASPSSSDLFFSTDFEHLPQAVVTKPLAAADCFWGETARDNELARSLGFRGVVLPPMARVRQLPRATRAFRPSQSHIVALSVSGDAYCRAFMGHRALIECAKQLKGFHLALCPGGDPRAFNLQVMSGIFRSETGLPVTITRTPPAARLWVSLGTDREIGASAVRAARSGSFPILSRANSARSWIRDGENGFVVDPMDLRALKEKIRIVLNDDRMVDECARMNASFMKDELDSRRNRILKAYEEILP